MTAIALPDWMQRCNRTVGLFFAVIWMAILAGCSTSPMAFFAIRSAPEKTADATQSPQIESSLNEFRKALVDGAYDRLPELRNQLTGAYLANPRHPTVALYLGMAHIWSLSESGRIPTPTPTVTDHAILANKYLAEAVRLAPEDLRIPGFLASTELALGSLHQDEKLTRTGYFRMLDSYKRKPDFNGFTASYVLSQNIGRDPSQLDDLIDYMWRSVEDCFGRSLDRKALDMRALIVGGFETASEAKRRTCWNTGLVPHNVEGFFMHFGDLYVARGDLQAAEILYRNASALPSYPTWKYRPMLEARIANREGNAKLFRTPASPGKPTLMVTDTYSCSACHQK